MRQIIICHEKHGEFYYDASTPEKLASSALSILTERFETGYMYWDPRAHRDAADIACDELAALTDEQIEAIPSDEVRVVTRKKRRAARSRKRKDEETLVQFDRIKAAVEAKNGQEAWELLQERSDHEYERIELEVLR